KMATSLIETMAADFEPEKYEDDYQNQLKELIETKAAGGEAFTVPERGESEDDGDDEGAHLLAALRASVEDRGGDAVYDHEASGEGKKRSTRKKGGAAQASANTSAPRKAGGSKSAASKSTAKKTSASKSTVKKSPAKDSAKSRDSAKSKDSAK